MQQWRVTAKAILATAALTSAAWLIGGAWWLQQERARWVAAGAAPVLAENDAVVARATRPVRPEATVGRGRARLERISEPIASRLAIPVAGIQTSELIDTFTQARAGGRRVHDAIDIIAPRGVPVVAAAAGRVEKVFHSEPGGKTLYIRSPDRTLIYYYAHLDAYATGLSEGQQVRAGQPLGTVGSTGNADPRTPHLHFAVMRARPEARWWEAAIALNPYPLLTGR